MQVLVLEARDRIGGRVWTETLPKCPVPVELGAEFVQGTSNALYDILKQAGVTVSPVPGSVWWSEGELLTI